jgi:hypothetical protein
MSRIFDYFTKSILTLTSKHRFILLTCSHIIKIPENILIWEAFVSDVQTELNNISYTDFPYQLALFEIS